MSALRPCLWLIFVTAAFACRRDDTSAVTSRPATKPTAVPSLNSPSFITIDGRPFQFPPAHLRITCKDSAVFIQLYSEDPSSAPATRSDDKTDTAGYYFDMTLDGADPANLSSAPWLFTSSPNERAESPNAITLEPTSDTPARQLQPIDIRVDFNLTANPATLHLSGKFAVFIGPESIHPAQIVPVSATFIPDVHTTDTSSN